MGPPPGTLLQNLTDAQLVGLARGRDKHAFGLLLQRHESAIRRFAIRMAGDPDTASELLQQAMLQAYLSLDRLRDPCKFRSWICGILKNLCRSRFREGWGELAIEGIPEGLDSRFAPSDFASPQASVEDKELQQAVMITIGRLPPGDGRVLRLFYFEDMSVLEIASRLAISATAAKVRLHRARRKFKRALEENYPEVVPFARRKRMVKVTIADVVKQEVPDVEARPPYHHVVLLEDKAGNRALPIWIGRIEAQAIAMGLMKFSTPRPLTADFMASILRAVDARVQDVVISSIDKGTFFARVHVGPPEGARDIDARPSDALALAARLGTPILVEEEVMKTASLPIPKTKKPRRALSGAESIVKELDMMTTGAKQIIASVYGE